MSKELQNIPCVDCELELAESPVDVPPNLSRPQEDPVAKLRQLWRTASREDRDRFLDWISNQERRS